MPIICMPQPSHLMGSGHDRYSSKIDMGFTPWWLLKFIAPPFLTRALSAFYAAHPSLFPSSARPDSVPAQGAQYLSGWRGQGGTDSVPSYPAGLARYVRKPFGMGPWYCTDGALACPSGLNQVLLSASSQRQGQALFSDLAHHASHHRPGHRYGHHRSLTPENGAAGWSSP